MQDENKAIASKGPIISRTKRSRGEKRRRRTRYSKDKTKDRNGKRARNTTFNKIQEPKKKNTKEQEVSEDQKEKKAFWTSRQNNILFLACSKESKREENRTKKIFTFCFSNKENVFR